MVVISDGARSMATPETEHRPVAAALAGTIRGMFETPPA